MLLLSLAATVITLLLAGWTIASVLERFVTQGLDERLDSQVALLASTVDAQGRVDRERLSQRTGALDGGPGWRWQILSRDGAVGSADFPMLDPGPPRPARSERHDDGVREIGRLQPLDGVTELGTPIHARRLTIQTRGGPVLLTAAAPRDVVRRPIRGALLPLLAILAMLAGLLGAATFVQLRIGLGPLRKLRDQVAAIRAGTRDVVDEEQPTELQPLAIELNALATQNATALAAARQSAANLAHALKTPVAALALDVGADPAMASQVARIDATIRHHLSRARLQATDRRATTALNPAIADLVDTVRRIHAARDLTFTTQIDDHLTAAMDASDLDELLGNLLDNAARHAAAHVTIRCTPDLGEARKLRIEISDDGSGIPEEERERVARPGIRLDERGDGHGFGLAIAVELTTLYGGDLHLEDNYGGGLRVIVTLPAAN